VSRSWRGGHGGDRERASTPGSGTPGSPQAPAEDGHVDLAAAHVFGVAPDADPVQRIQKDAEDRI
jgi:hypothetical protein